MNNSASLSEAQKLALRRIEEYPAPYVIGVDEVGIGPWAGPVVVAGCVLRKGWSDASIKDSKCLTPNRRKEASKIIRENALLHVILDSPNTMIDAHGIGVVRAWLTESVILYCLRRFPDALVVQDGDVPIPVAGNPPMIWLAKADAYVTSVSAASVIAKEHRDAYMIEQHKFYPQYGFKKHKGYGTEFHAQQLELYGLCPLHRTSYKPVASVMEMHKRATVA